MVFLRQRGSRTRTMCGPAAVIASTLVATTTLMEPPTLPASAIRCRIVFVLVLVLVSAFIPTTALAAPPAPVELSRQTITLPPDAGEPLFFDIEGNGRSD